MADEFFCIWARSVLKKIIKPELYILVCTNMEVIREEMKSMKILF